MSEHEKIDYIELPANDLVAVKNFFKAAFNWEFEDFGDGYTAFSNQGVDGGFYQSDMNSSADKGAALVVFYSDNLEDTQRRLQVRAARYYVRYLHSQGAGGFTLQILVVTNMQCGLKLMSRAYSGCLHFDNEPEKSTRLLPR